MDYFNYQNTHLYAEDVPVAKIAKEIGTPCYVYSKKTLTHHWQVFDQILGDYPHRIHYAVKANSNIALLNVLAKLGSGFDIVSEGELARVLAAGGDPAKIIFSGVAKSKNEIKEALLAGIHCFNVESPAELKRIAEIARQQNCLASVALRINPNVDGNSHPHISTGKAENKFGIPLEDIPQLCQTIQEISSIKLVGLTCHIGSQILDLAPLKTVLDRLIALIHSLRSISIEIEHLNLGGGLGVRYYQEVPPSLKEYADLIISKLKTLGIPVFLEPGRVIIANAGILLTTVEYLKHSGKRNFAIVDAGMNDCSRPALYDAYHEIIPIEKQDHKTTLYDVVGPICESSDYLGKNRSLAIACDDILAMRSAGAYCFSMSSNYNSRGRPAEVMVDGDTFHVIREREEVKELFQLERLLPNG